MSILNSVMDVYSSLKGETILGGSSNRFFILIPECTAKMSNFMSDETSVIDSKKYLYIQKPTFQTIFFQTYFSQNNFSHFCGKSNSKSSETIIMKTESMTK